MTGSSIQNAYGGARQYNYNRHTTMSDRSDDSIVGGIWESANRLADDLGIATINRFSAWVNEHATSKRAAFVQDGATLALLAIAWYTVAPHSRIIEGAIVVCACFVITTVVYRIAVNL